jgi:hypothetical protein
VSSCQSFVARRCDPSINCGQLGGVPSLADLNTFSCRSGATLFLWYHTCRRHKPWYHRCRPRGSANFRLGPTQATEDANPQTRPKIVLIPSGCSCRWWRCPRNGTSVASAAGASERVADPIHLAYRAAPGSLRGSPWADFSARRFKLAGLSFAAQSGGTGAKLAI